MHPTTILPDKSGVPSLSMTEGAGDSQVVINNAGVYGSSRTLQTASADDMLFTFKANAVGPLLVVQQLLKHQLIGKPGTIIANVTSKVVFGIHNLQAAAVFLLLWRDHCTMFFGPCLKIRGPNKTLALQLDTCRRITCRLLSDRRKYILCLYLPMSIFTAAYAVNVHVYSVDSKSHPVDVRQVPFICFIMLVCRLCFASHSMPRLLTVGILAVSGCVCVVWCLFICCRLPSHMLS